MEVLRKEEGFQGQKAIVIPGKIIADQCTGNALTEGLHITDIGYYPRARFHYRERPRGADQHIFIYCLEGKGEALINGARYAVGAGEFFTVPPGTTHHYAADKADPWTIYWIHFKGSTADEISRLLLQKNNGHKGFKQYTDNTVQLFDKIYQQLERGYSMDHFTCASMCLHHFFADFLHGTAAAATGGHQLKAPHELAIDFLNRNLDKMLPLEKMAASINLSPTYFSSVFKKKTGFTPIEYFNQLKIQKTCQYLLFTDLRVKEIAQELGIEDQFYFSRLFTKIMGMSPNEYRQRQTHLP